MNLQTTAWAAVLAMIMLKPATGTDANHMVATNFIYPVLHIKSTNALFKAPRLMMTLAFLHPFFHLIHLLVKSLYYM
jgi:hypothetical protein